MHPRFSSPSSMNVHLNLRVWVHCVWFIRFGFMILNFDNVSVKNLLYVTAEIKLSINIHPCLFHAKVGDTHKQNWQYLPALSLPSTLQTPFLNVS